MEKILKETSVYPKVTISEEEYNCLVSLARAKAKQIEERAVAYYEKNGVCNIHVDAYVRQINGACDNIETTFRFDCKPQYCYVRPSDECEANPFAIDQKTRQRIGKFVTEYISSSFKTAFGKQLMSINNAQRYEFRARHEWIIMRSVTVIGWLLAIAMLIIVLLR